VTKPALILIEGPEKTTRVGVNGSQSKFLEGIWPISIVFKAIRRGVAIHPLLTF
jgi:hypothetical protein